MASNIPRHKVFISFHEQDIQYKKDFVRMMGNRIVDRSVDTGNIDDTGLKTATVRQKIRDDYIRDATVTIVLIGSRTWQRKACRLGNWLQHSQDQEESQMWIVRHCASESSRLRKRESLTRT